MDEVGTILKQSRADEEGDSFRLWEVTLGSSGRGDLRLKLVQLWRNDLKTLGYETYVSLTWIVRYTTVHADPPTAPPIGDGVMYAEVYGGEERVIHRHSLEGSAASMIEWITDVCGQLDTNGTPVFAHWWGYDPSPGDAPDMTAHWTNEQLVWSDN